MVLEALSRSPLDSINFPWFVPSIPNQCQDILFSQSLLIWGWVWLVFSGCSSFPFANQQIQFKCWSYLFCNHDLIKSSFYEHQWWALQHHLTVSHYWQHKQSDRFEWATRLVCHSSIFSMKCVFMLFMPQHIATESHSPLNSAIELCQQHIL